MRTVSTMIFTALASSMAMAASVPPGMSLSEEQTKQSMQELGGEIKAATLFGLLDDEAARDLYFEIIEFQYGEGKGDDKEDEGENDGEDDKRRGGMTFARFLVPDGGDFTTLFRPEFVSRDIEPLTEVVGDDPGLIAVIESLLEDYEQEFEIRSRAFQESLDVARAGYEFALIDQSLSLIPEIPLTRAEIDRRVEAWNAESGLGRRDPAKVADWAEQKITALQSRVGRLREAVAALTARIEADGGAPSARELLAMMAALRQARIELRQVLEVNLQSVVPDAMASDIQAALDRIRLEHGRIDARFGGADIDLERAVLRSELPAETEASVLEELVAANALIADLVDARTAARVEREAKAAQLLAAEVEGDESRLSQRSRAVMTAADREIASGLAVRDAILGQMMQIHETLVEVDPTLAAGFLEITRRDGFPDQMRRRWCERAIEAAMQIPELADAMLEAILELQSYVDQRLEPLQAQAIADRIVLEPRLGRAMVDGLEDDFASAKDMGDKTWREPGFEQFDQLDDEIGRRLLAILGSELVNSLPRHESLGTLRPEKKSEGKGDAKGDTKSRSNGKARDSKRTGGGAKGGRDAGGK
ncbi:MAG: hypothetical protein CMJ23_12100 [Phycisphaerae bacterium]|nr:hypothetical protein [Phycisphaerae bacterium]